MTYQNQNSAYVAAVRQLFCATRDADLNQSGANFIEAAKQRKLLTRNICLADFLGYQPNMHVKFMYFGW